MIDSVTSRRGARRALHVLMAVVATIALAACETTVPGGDGAVQARTGSRPQATAPAAPSVRTQIPPAPPAGSPTPGAAPSSLAAAPAANAVLAMPATDPAASQSPAPSAAAETRPGLATQAKIAALLPLSGANAAIGGALLEAMNLAVADAKGGIPVEFLPRDTGGTPEGARAAAASALEAGATVLVGPLLGAELPAVADIARTASVPVLGLTNNAAIAAPGVFVLGFLPQTQVERLVGFARAKGARRFALVMPNDEYGALVEGAFRNAVAAGGGIAVAIERHGGDMPGMSASVKRIAAAIDRIDALVIAGNGDTLLLAASFVPYYDIDAKEKHILVATLSWDDPRLAREVALYGAYVAAPLTARREDFLRRYKDTYRKDAPRLASLGYDAAALAIAALREAGDGALGPVLVNPGGFEGYEGLFRLLPDGTNLRQLPILQFQRGGPKVIEDPANGPVAPGN